MKRTVRINTEYNPPVSGYAGWDEWVVEDLPDEGIDALNDLIELAVKQVAKQYKTKGYWNGSS